MKRGNQGYSLIELVVTMGIFSIIMVAIIMIMRTSIASYKDGLFEASIQEEAQIVANQIADALVDCTAYTKSNITYEVDEHGDYVLDEITGKKKIKDTSYSFVGPNGSEDSIVLKAEGTELYYNSHLLSDMLAENGFEIQGLDTREKTKAVYDNVATVVITIEKNGREYTATKDVYFRNQIEYQDVETNPDPFDIKNAPDNKTGLGSGENVATILRYHPFDLSEKYGIISDVKFSDSADDIFWFFNESGNLVTKFENCNNNTYFSGENTKKHVIIGVKEPGPSNFTTKTTENPEDYYIVGKNAGGDSVKVYLELEPVTIQATTKPKTPGIYVMRGAGTYPGGYPTHPVVTGIDINNAASKLTIKYTAEFYSNDVLQKNSSNSSIFIDKTITHIDSEYVDQNAISNLGIDYKYPFALCPEPIDGGIVMTASGFQYENLKNQPANYGDFKFLQDDNNVYKTVIKIYFQGKTEPYELSYYLKGSGESLEDIN